jgi:hypothetical protein
MCGDKELEHGQDECKCDHPEIRDSHEDGRCSREQILKCHGAKMLRKWEREEKVKEK